MARVPSRLVLAWESGRQPQKSCPHGGVSLPVRASRGKGPCWYGAQGGEEATCSCLRTFSNHKMSPKAGRGAHTCHLGILGVQPVPLST